MRPSRLLVDLVLAAALAPAALVGLPSLARATRAPVVRSVLEPIYRARWSRGRAGANACCGVFDSFDAAERSIPAGRPKGYDHPALASFYRDIHDRPRLTDYPVLHWLKPLVADTGRIFDFGGHVGVAAYALHRHLGEPATVRWTVCEVPAIAEAGRALARERGRDDLHFTTDFTACDGADVLTASGSLQYLDEGFLPEQLAALAAPPAHLFINNIPLHPTRTYFTVQCTGPSFHAYTVHGRPALVEGLAALGYRLVDSWDCMRRLDIPFEPDGTAHYEGLYLARRPA